MMVPTYGAHQPGAHLSETKGHRYPTVTSPSSSPESVTVSMAVGVVKRTSRAKPTMRSSRTSTQLVMVKKEVTVGKKIGKRNGPLSDTQRQKAGETRKAGACLRCRYLKKTCDTGDPCGGCRPHHARLWQVPCTRISIQDLFYFAKDWKGDYERPVGFYKAIGPPGAKQVPLWITHGYDIVLPVMTHEYYVEDESDLRADWKEAAKADEKPKPTEFTSSTANLQANEGAISQDILSDYVDIHIDKNFPAFVDTHFEGTRFISEMLKTVHKYYRSTGSPVIRKALKLVVAYNLTMHITMVEDGANNMHLEGKVVQTTSKHWGKTLAPRMVNYEVKYGLAQMWRDLMKEVLVELAALYTSVYNGDKLKHWATIFMLDSVLLAVWEEMQFDAQYVSDDEHASRKFCDEMESTPVGVIVGLFAAISQKLPSFTDWDTSKHQHILYSDGPACEAMTEVRQHMMKHGKLTHEMRKAVPALT